MRPTSVSLLLALVALLVAEAVELKPRAVLPGSIATLKAASRGAARDNQTMTAVLDARRAMLAAAAAAANESARPVARPGRDTEDAAAQEDPEDQHQGELHAEHPTAAATAAATAEGEDQGDEHRPQNHRVVLHPTTAQGAQGEYSPGMEVGVTSTDQYGYDGPTRHIHIHQHHLGASAGAAAGAAAHSGPSGAGGARRPAPAQTPGLSHYRAATSAPSAPTGPGAGSLHGYKPVKFESEEQQQQQHYSVHEDQDHLHVNHNAVHSAIAAAHPVGHHEGHSAGHGVAGEATGELAVGIGLGAGLAEGVGGGGEGLQYPLLGAAPYDHPKVLPHAVEPLSFSHKPKKGKLAHSLWKSALRVVAGLAPLALLVAAIQPNVLVIDPRLGTRQRSSDGRSPLQRCEQRAICEVARASGPHALHALLISTPPARVQSLDLEAVSKAVEMDSCGQFQCAEYDSRAEASTAANLTATLLTPTPGPPAVATTPMTATRATAVRRTKERKRKKVVNGGPNYVLTTTEAPFKTE